MSIQSAREYARVLRSIYTDDQLRRGFVDKSLDKEFLNVGEEITVKHAPNYIKVWNGFDLTVQNKYCAVNV